VIAASRLIVTVRVHRGGRGSRVWRSMVVHLSVFPRLVTEALSRVWPGARHVRRMLLFVGHVDDRSYDLHDSGEKT
jgi:hypothetical protein